MEEADLETPSCLELAMLVASKWLEASCGDVTDDWVVGILVIGDTLRLRALGEKVIVGLRGLVAIRLQIISSWLIVTVVDVEVVYTNIRLVCDEVADL